MLARYRSHGGRAHASCSFVRGRPCILTTMPVDFSSVLLHDELYLSSKYLEEDDVASTIRKELAQPVAEVVFQVVCAVVEFLFRFDNFDNW